MTGADLIALARKHPISTACVLVIVVCGLLTYFRLDVIEASQAEYETKSGEAAKTIANVKNAPGLEDQVAELQRLGKELDSRLIKVDQLAVNLQYFYRLETENGVKLLDVRQNAPVRARTAKPNFTVVPFSVTVQGSYAQVMKFLGALQTGRHFCRVANATFSKVGGIGSTDNGLSPDAQELNLSLSLELLGQP